MVEETSKRLLSGAAAILIFVSMTTIFLIQGVDKKEIFEDVSKGTVEYRARERFYASRVGIIDSKTNDYKRDSKGEIVAKGKVKRLDYFLELAKHRFNNRDFKRF